VSFPSHSTFVLSCSSRLSFCFVCCWLYVLLMMIGPENGGYSQIRLVQKWPLIGAEYKAEVGCGWCPEVGVWCAD
jgi:hypothetical protein